MLIHKESPQVSRGGHSGPSEKLLTLGAYRPCDGTFQDMYQQICINQNFVSINFGFLITLLIEPRWADY